MTSDLDNQSTASGYMSDEEVLFLTRLANVFRDIATGKRSLQFGLLLTRNDLTTLQRQLVAGCAIDTGQTYLGRIDSHGEENIQPKASESEFARDMAGFLDYATRNRLPFDRAFAVVAHDLRELAAFDDDAESATSRGFVEFMSSGWADRNAMGVADTEPD